MCDFMKPVGALVKIGQIYLQSEPHSFIKVHGWGHLHLQVRNDILLWVRAPLKEEPPGQRNINKGIWDQATSSPGKSPGQRSLTPPVVIKGIVDLGPGNHVIALSRFPTHPSPNIIFAKVTLSLSKTYESDTKIDFSWSV